MLKIFGSKKGMKIDKKYNAFIALTLLPQIVLVIADKEGIDEITALNEFYHSKVYEILEDEETKVWNYSPLTIYLMWKSEKETGKIDYPEDQS